MTWDVVPFGNIWDNEIRQRSASWDRLVDVLTTFRHHTGAKKEIPGWSPATYNAGTTRGRAGVRSLSCLVLDYDNGTPIDVALDSWHWRPGILHTTWSHTIKVHKYRVILPLHRPVSVADWPAVFRWAERWTRQCVNVDQLNGPEDYPRAEYRATIDPQCKDPGRFYFVPAIPADDAPRFATSWRAGGDYLGVHTPWDRELGALREEEARRAKRAPMPRHESRVSWGIADQRVKLRLRKDPTARRDLGVKLGGVDRGATITKVPCPGCGSADVWWFIDAERKTGAECNHQNSCGWRGSLWELAHG